MSVWRVPQGSVLLKRDQVRHGDAPEVPTTQDLATGWCAGCPIFTECDEAANEYKVTFGTFAGRDRTRESRR